MAGRDVSSTPSSARRPICCSAYRPTAAVPDPEAPKGAEPVRVGRYHARFYHFLASFLRAPGSHIVVRELIRELYVELPIGRGRVRDLAVGAARVSRAQLIRIVARGLSSR